MFVQSAAVCLMIRMSVMSVIGMQREVSSFAVCLDCVWLFVLNRCQSFNKEEKKTGAIRSRKVYIQRGKSRS